MRVISRRLLEEFWENHPDSELALRQWYKAALAARWTSLADVRRIYPHADGVSTRTSGHLTVFNVCGNKYRLIVRIRYDWNLINIRCVLSHAEYDQGFWRE